MLVLCEICILTYWFLTYISDAGNFILHFMNWTKKKKYVFKKHLFILQIIFEHDPSTYCKGIYTDYLVQVKVKVKFSCYRPGMAWKVGRGIALLFHNRGTRRGWVVGSTPRLHFTPEKDPVPILQEAGWSLVPVWRGGKPRPHRDSIPDRPARSQSLYRLSYPGHT